ncbi:extracellular serine-rich protein [Drechmeria coniospora]|uniref:Extracellular serine-rich protein n=1 Tax=Drechmeria coniospora TaxID=98403 RepID=A0A151GUM5_DRECN|nr:extracellular serine-rich protein [Drechmeria coniospora]KYK60816.1 extracellular serine-rich protein [Drechmeria coniospora]
MLLQNVICWIGSILGIGNCDSTAAVAVTVDSTVLVIARNDVEAQQATLGLDGYGISYEKLLVPQAGAPLPVLNSSLIQGRYGAIVTINDVSYDVNATWISAITDQQWSQIHSYQSAFNVRMVRLNEYPKAEFGEQGSANFTWEIASFEAAGSFTTKTTAAVINSLEGRQQMVWFISWAPEWSATTNYLQHAYIHWMTRGLFSGKRKTHLSAQVDDVQLETGLYKPNGTAFKIRTGDLDAHVTWQRNINARLPTGSSFWLEMGHNGNGDIDDATNTTTGATLCKPAYAVNYDSPPDTALEYKKTPGTGTDLWPAEFEKYGWSLTCARLSPLAAWFTSSANLNAFAHVSHTFSHEELNNATYHDAAREIAFNQAWLKQMGIDRATRFSPKGIIPPAITGLHNADAIKGWTDNGIAYVVGDNTRPVLRNQQSRFWPLASTVESNGNTGITIIPRYATTIYYNCDKADCTVQEWKDTSAGQGDFTSLLNDARATNTRYLLGLQADPYMFHQANMRQTDVESITVGSQTGKMSLIMSWVETIAQEMYRLTNWPIISLKHDDIATYFLNRQALDACKPKVSYTFAADGNTIVSVTVTTKDNTCSVPVPVTFPTGTVTASGGTSTLDKVGSEPPISWLKFSGKAITLKLATPVKI